MTICEWPLHERPREKLLSRGPAALSDAELLAIFLRTGVAGKTAVDLARELLVQYGGLRSLLLLDQQQFSAHHGLGRSKYVLLQAGLELSRRHLFETLQQGDALTSSVSTRRYLQATLRDEPRELFACLFLDNQHRVLCFEVLFHGTINAASVYPREVVSRCLAHRAATVILAHNHPSGVAEPSAADRAITRKLCEALALVDIRVLDHFVVGDGETVSFAERGWL